MKSKPLILIAFSLCINAFVWAQNENIIKVACIGNSITYGAGIQDRVKNAYPAQLGRMLGEGYEVKNYGYSGRTLLLKGNHPYMAKKMFSNAIQWKPNVVIIKLGTNDSKAKNRKYKTDFESDYHTIIRAFDTINPRPKIYLATLVPVFKKGLEISATVVENEINPLIQKIAKDNKLKLIDLYSPLLDKGDLFPDHIHPNAEGAGKMAKVVYKQITGKNGKLVNQLYPGKVSYWKSFERYEFKFEGRKAQITKPKKALAGKPWVWRARFPKWHTEMDSILLSEGYHVVFVNTNNMYGSPKAIKIWDGFYKYLTKNHGFNAKVTLEGVSRGGLYVYNWAKKNPEKVNSIYTEAPVCDFKSWPAGFGDGIGSANDWKNLKKEYGFISDEQAKAYKNNPIDNLDILAKAKVPILHMIGLDDGVVPCTEGKQELYGHHFDIETPRLGADFIKYNTQLPKQKLNAANYHSVRGGLKNSFIKFEREKKGRVAFLGGSITYNHGWRDSLMQYMQKKFPKTKFEFIAAGIPSFGSTENVFRLKRDVLAKGPVDLVFVEAAVNDGGKGRTQEEIMRSMEGTVRHLRKENPSVDIVFMYFVDPAKIEDYSKGKTPQVIQNHDKVAVHYNIPALNLAKEVTERIGAGEFTWKDDFKNLHPSPFGQGVYAHSMITFLRDAWSGFVAEDDKISNYTSPDKLDKASYDNGELIPAKEIKLIKGWTFVENWNPKIKANTRANFSKVPMLVGTYPTKILKYKFEGNAVGVAVAAGPDAGILEYKIDGGKWQQQDLFTKHSKRYHLPWYFTLASGLKSEKHILQLRMSQEKNENSVGNSCVLRYLYVNKSL